MNLLEAAADYRPTTPADRILSMNRDQVGTGTKYGFRSISCGTMTPPCTTPKLGSRKAAERIGCEVIRIIVSIPSP
jgi:hypothetical protein